MTNLFIRIGIGIACYMGFVIIFERMLTVLIPEASAPW